VPTKVEHTTIVIIIQNVGFGGIHCDDWGVFAYFISNGSYNKFGVIISLTVLFDSKFATNVPRSSGGIHCGDWAQRLWWN
jgi:hypothetical protein